jgi:hypothetical protein
MIEVDSERNDKFGERTRVLEETDQYEESSETVGMPTIVTCSGWKTMHR